MFVETTGRENTMWRYDISAKASAVQPLHCTFIITEDCYMLVYTSEKSSGYLWNRIGEQTFKEFILNASPEYLTEKLFGCYATINRSITNTSDMERKIGKEILKLRREKLISKHDARLEYNFFKEFGSYYWVENTELDISNLTNEYPWWVELFKNDVLPKLKKMIGEEK
jgi:hypothetical protein